MINHTKKLFLACAVIALSQTPQSSALFCTVQEYVHPETGKSVWLFGDVHCDVDPMMTMTRLQKHDLFAAAQERDALIIAENVEAPSQNLLNFAIPFGIDAFIFYKAIKNSSYKTFFFGALLTSAHITQLLKTISLNQKPATTVDDYIKELKKNSPTTSLPLYRWSPLFNLVPESKSRGIAALDVEFRRHFIGAHMEAVRVQQPWLGQMPYFEHHIDFWLYRKTTGNYKRYPLTLADYCRSSDEVVATIASYSDNPVLGTFYQECLDTYKTSYMTQLLYKLAEENPDMSLTTIIPTLVAQSGKDTATVLRDFTEHNVSLFDAKLMHAIYNNQLKRNTIFVCTGVLHAERINTVLEQLGYQAKTTAGKDNFKTMQKNGVIGRSYIQTAELDCFVVDLEKVFAQKIS